MTTETATSARELDDALAELAQLVRAVTVRVDDGRRGAGAGVIWNATAAPYASGIVISNAHVVRGRAATIELADGTRLRATVERRDETRDLALLHLETGGLPPVVQTLPHVRAAARLRPGELVAAVGHPHGLPGSLALGAVQRANPRLVVADVRLYPGNSGGPLVDMQGRVVGINAMVARGYGLAIPSEVVREFLAQAGASRAA